MANHKSAEKRARQSIVKNARNTAKKSAVKTAVKKLRKALVENNSQASAELLVNTQKLLARLAKSGVIKKGAAARKTSRLAAQVAKLQK